MSKRRQEVFETLKSLREQYRDSEYWMFVTDVLSGLKNAEPELVALLSFDREDIEQYIPDDVPESQKERIFEEAAKCIYNSTALTEDLVANHIRSVAFEIKGLEP
ncbi:MAG: hypothetical protein D6732_00440 [Methanobacteriota archaeon]|nr:MAG: hypothetical protein D6732_00440 [Euryarchaeota archaeon]